jgi:arylsulfatase A-like enzyme
MPARDLEHVVALYDGEIRFTDEYVARLRAVLERLGVLDNTIVVVTADHGEEFFEHGEKGHAKQLYDETILVPLVIRFPPVVGAGRVVQTPVRLADVAPTILSLTGVPAPAWFGSTSLDATRAARDLRPLLGGDLAPADGPPAVADLRGRMRALRTADWKLITHPDTRRELYDLAADPAERRDVSASRAEVVTALTEEAGRWGRGDRSAPPRVELSREHLDRLRALGYVE